MIDPSPKFQHGWQTSPARRTPKRWPPSSGSGERSGGTTVNDAMPFAMLREMSDDDIDARYAFLKTQPANEMTRSPAHRMLRSADCELP